MPHSAATLRIRTIRASWLCLIRSPESQLQENLTTSFVIIYVRLATMGALASCGTTPYVLAGGSSTLSITHSLTNLRTMNLPLLTIQVMPFPTSCTVFTTVTTS